MAIDVVSEVYVDRPRQAVGAGVLFKVAGPLIARFVKSRVDGHLRQLKQLLESSPG